MLKNCIQYECMLIRHEIQGKNVKQKNEFQNLNVKLTHNVHHSRVRLFPERNVMHTFCTVVGCVFFDTFECNQHFKLHKTLILFYSLSLTLMYYEWRLMRTTTARLRLCISSDCQWVFWIARSLFVSICVLFSFFSFVCSFIIISISLFDRSR